MGGILTKQEHDLILKESRDTFPIGVFGWEPKREPPDQVLRSQLELVLPVLVSRVDMLTQTVASLAGAQGQAFVASAERPVTGDAALQQNPAERVRLLEERIDKLESALGEQGGAGP